MIGTFLDCGCYTGPKGHRMFCPTCEELTSPIPDAVPRDKTEDLVQHIDQIKASLTEMLMLVNSLKMHVLASNKDER